MINGSQIMSIYKFIYLIYMCYKNINLALGI
jgi:hypothetical protein